MHKKEQPEMTHTTHIKRGSTRAKLAASYDMSDKNGERFRAAGIERVNKKVHKKHDKTFLKKNRIKGDDDGLSI